MKGKLKENNKIIDKLSLLEPAAEFKSFLKKDEKLSRLCRILKKKFKLTFYDCWRRDAGDVLCFVCRIDKM